MSKHIHIHALENRVAGPDEPNVVFYETPNAKLRLPDDVAPCGCGWSQIADASEPEPRSMVGTPPWDHVHFEGKLCGEHSCVPVSALKIGKQSACASSSEASNE